MSKPPIRQLQDWLAQQGLAGMVVPRADQFQGEYVAPAFERLAWLTGFGGSAGLAVVLTDRAALFVDGRYTLQAEREVDPALITPIHSADQSPWDWIAETLPQGGARLGFDPWLVTVDGLRSLDKACARAGACPVPLAVNPVDLIWSDRPPLPQGPILGHDLAHCGMSSRDKRAGLAQEMVKAKLDALVLADPASVAWVLNIRGTDVPFTPLPLAFAIMHADCSVSLYLEPERLAAPLDKDVRILAPHRFIPDLKAMGGKRVRLDPAQTAQAIAAMLEEGGAELDLGPDPSLLLRAAKNKVELAGIRAAHRRDGIAMIRFLRWLDSHPPTDEMDLADKLAWFRRQGDLFRDLSFPTIAGIGPNGAVVHYRSTSATNRPLTGDTLLLLDSGAQYLDGTTDITRTLAVGAPNRQMRSDFTLVMKGHIALSQAVFPAGTVGAQLDVLARQYLWRAGLDYDHGTGHGVGCYLSVHEGPQRIGKQGGAKPAPLLPGMILSVEPGLYRAGLWGIRIENLVEVVECPMPMGGERPLLGFVPLTLVPFDRRLLDLALLTRDEIAWIDAYHARILAELAPLLDEAERDWLHAACRPMT